MRSQDRFRGCLIGGAAGDALGYAVEFLGAERIFRRYGENGITEYDLYQGKALISDDTQMTLFTAAGLLTGSAGGETGDYPEAYAAAINEAYLDWLITQERRYSSRQENYSSWLMNLPELYSPRAPGNTCLAALNAGGGGSIEQPKNNSKGCGGVMRVAPIGLYFNDRQKGIREICRLGAQTAALTHGHPLGWMPAAALVQIIHEASQDDIPLEDAVNHALQTAEEMWPASREREDFIRLIRKAAELAKEELDDLDAIHELGEGWVAEEALAIAVYCALKYPGDIDRALIAAVNHDGDSDSTGAVVGNIVGAKVGLSGIPAKYTEKLELKDVILEIADDLWADGGTSENGDSAWEQKYVKKTYGRKNP